MSRYLISFRDEAMDYREEEVADIAAAASEMTREAIEAGVVTDGPYPESKEHLGVPRHHAGPRDAPRG